MCRCDAHQIVSRANCGRALSFESFPRKFPTESNRDGFVRTVFFGVLVNAFEYGAGVKEYKRVFFAALRNMLKGGANGNLRAHSLHPKNMIEMSL